MGHIKLHRKLFEWEWYGVPEMTALWIHLLLSANWEQKTWRGLVIERGQFVTSLSTLANDTGLSFSQVRLCLKRLQDSGQIKIDATNQMTKITICNYDSYQDKGDSQTQTDNTPESNQNASETATTKEVKKIRRKENNNIYSSDADKVYAAYPTKCPISGRSLGKSSSDKKKIERLLKAGRTPEELISTIEHYIADCSKTNTYAKNFSTFLNNLPDYSEPETESATTTPQNSLFYFENGERNRFRVPQT